MTSLRVAPALPAPALRAARTAPLLAGGLAPLPDRWSPFPASGAADWPPVHRWWARAGLAAGAVCLAALGESTGRLRRPRARLRGR
ncbi:hypothetical protein [Peterkaempfera bronchialis]|uniref:Uncharacterized protein n=1 Tax=Peterkaempfera bronchialis TaxID=2126346 RepID=A0A345SW99_9ACTN|nr:hypothetical protein [Peterkaempfera bronchialis]AXI78004.1 hypothetical protein C7M71_011720 [Peterkaempfera bronchialis]